MQVTNMHDFVTTGTVAIGRIEVQRMHAAGVYAGPAIAEFCDCRFLRTRSEVLFFGRWDDVRRAHSMLAMIKSAMDREFLSFLDARNRNGENPRSLAADFSRGMGHRISERLRRLKAGRAANVLASLAAAQAKFVRGLLNRASRHKPSSNSRAFAAGILAGGRLELTPRDLKALPKPGAMAQGAPH